GCGTGVHARAIAERWPERAVSGLDRAREMLAEAAAAPSPVKWVEADIARWSALEPASLVFSTAALQWLGDHARLFPHLLRQLAPDGTLAVQVPRNFAAPSHALMRETAREGPWAALLAPHMSPDAQVGTLLRTEPVLSPAAYYDLLRPMASALDLWETEYLHVLEGEDPVLEWVRGSALRPALEALPPTLAAGFEEAYRQRLRLAYPRRADGRTLLPFRRLFLVARR
ncbi:MAG: methyltransferase domain-containing protein, partial [Stellaceae bacterium]